MILSSWVDCFMPRYGLVESLRLAAVNLKECELTWCPAVTQRRNPSQVMEGAYEGNETRQLALALGFTTVAPPKVSPIDSWEDDREMYKRRNEIERRFCRLKGYLRIFSRFEKLDALFFGFILFALILNTLG